MSTTKTLVQLAIRIPCCSFMLYLLWLLGSGALQTVSAYAIPFHFSTSMIKVLHYALGAIFLLIAVLVIIQIFKPLAPSGNAGE